MNTISIDSNIYKGAESYAKLHNISVTAAIEKAISLFLQKVQSKQKLLETAEFNDALSYVKTLKAKGGKPIQVFIRLSSRSYPSIRIDR